MNRNFHGAMILSSVVALSPLTAVRGADVLSLDPVRAGALETATVSVVGNRTLYLAAAAGEPAAAMPRLVPVVDYAGDFMHRPALTGDWREESWFDLVGVRQQLMEKGIRFDLSVTQVYQRNFIGGRDNGGTYMARTDLAMKVDTGAAGLWPGGLLSLRAEGRWGQSDNADTGALLPVNTASIFPAGEKNIFALPELNYTQFLAPFVGVTFGKYGPRDANVFASNANDQFLNAAFNFDPIIATTVPLSFLGAGVIVLPFPDLAIQTLVFDTEGRGDTTGFNTAFAGGTSVMQAFDLTVKPFGLTGHQRVNWTWTDKVRSILDQTPRALLGALITGSTANLAKQSGDWSAFYDFDQFVYMVPGSTDRGIGIFGRVGYDDGDVNPVEQFYSFGVGGKGMIPSRENDTFGVAYYYLKVSNDLPQIVQNRSRDEQGVEMYYNFAVTPWLHVTPDLQIISPVRSGVDTTFVSGVRVKLDF